MNTILAAIDSSPAAGRVLKTAMELAGKYHARLHILNVAPRPDKDAVTEMRRIEDVSVDELATEAARDVLKRTLEAVPKPPGLIIEHDVAVGDPMTLILDSAERNHADLIVAGKHGYGRLKGLLVGSVSQGLVASASCPVLVIP